MWFYVIFGAILFLALIGIGVIIARKLPQLILVDADVLPTERDREKKRAIIEARVHRLAQASWRKTAGALAPFLVKMRDLFRSQFKRLLTIDKKFRNEKLLTKKSTAESTVAKLHGAAKRLVEDEKYGEAEKKYIEIVSIDGRNREAYIGLADLYVRQKRYHRARETLAFLIKMEVLEGCGQPVADVKGIPTPRWEAFSAECRATAAVHAAIAARFEDFADACREAGDGRAVRHALESAVAFQPANPKYLDLLLEACIVEGDKQRASQVLGRLSEVNPENQKLPSLLERVARLEGAVPENGNERRKMKKSA